MQNKSKVNQQIILEQPHRDPNRLLSDKEEEKLIAFFGLLIQIDRRLKKQAKVKHEK